MIYIRQISLLAFSIILLCGVNTTADVASRTTKVRLMAVGDIQVGRGVGERIKERGPEWLFEDVRQVLWQADLLFGNLECPLSNHNEPAEKRYVFRGDPMMAKELRSSGFHALAVANNHSHDHGKKALEDTLKNLADAGILAVGGGIGPDEQFKPKIIEINMQKIAFFGAQNIGWYPQKKGQPTVASIDTKRLSAEIKAIRDKVNYVIVSLHWGIEFSYIPTEKQRQIAYELVDAGANVILGHHPHVIQGIERYKHAIIAYSLGNFVFDQRDNPENESIILVLDLYPNGVISTPIVAPIEIRSYRPELDYTKNGETTINRLIEYSKNLGSGGIINYYWFPIPKYTVGFPLAK